MLSRVLIGSATHEALCMGHVSLPSADPRLTDTLLQAAMTGMGSSTLSLGWHVQAVQKITGVSLHGNRTLQYLSSSHLDVISEGDEEELDSDNEAGMCLVICASPSADSGHASRH